MFFVIAAAVFISVAVPGTSLRGRSKTTWTDVLRRDMKTSNVYENEVNDGPWRSHTRRSDHIAIPEINSEEESEIVQSDESEWDADVSTGLPDIPAEITIHKEIKDWDGAYSTCNLEGAVLASPINTPLLNIMRSLIGINNTPYLIGTRFRECSRSFTSIEGVPFRTMTAAMLQMVQHLDPHEGDCLSMDAYSIRVVPCWERLPFMCYRAPTTEKEVEEEVEEEAERVVEVEAKAEAAEEAEKEAEEGAKVDNTEDDVNTKMCGAEEYIYNMWTSSCYKLHEDEKTWEDALLQCVTEGGHLVVIEDRLEAMAVHLLILKNKKQYAFIGLRDYGGDDVWTTFDGQPIGDIYLDWATPIRYETKDCVVMLSTGKLESYNCNVHGAYVCEITNHSVPCPPTPSTTSTTSTPPIIERKRSVQQPHTHRDYSWNSNM